MSAARTPKQQARSTSPSSSSDGTSPGRRSSAPGSRASSTGPTRASASGKLVRAQTARVNGRFAKKATRAEDGAAATGKKPRDTTNHKPRDFTRSNRFTYAFVKAAKPNLGHSEEHLEWLLERHTPGSEEWIVGSNVMEKRCEAFVPLPRCKDTSCWCDVRVIDFRKYPQLQLPGRLKKNQNYYYFAEVETKNGQHTHVVHWTALRVFP